MSFIGEIAHNSLSPMTNSLSCSSRKRRLCALSSSSKIAAGVAAAGADAGVDVTVDAALVLGVLLCFFELLPHDRIKRRF